MTDERAVVGGCWQPPALEDIPSVEEILDSLEGQVMGLETAKRRLAVVLRRHAVAAYYGRDFRQPNLLVIGPTGGGKSKLVETMVDSFNLPHIIVNATQFSEVGFAGLDVSQMLSGFWSPRWAGMRSDGRPGARANVIPHAERWGIVVIDEIDKWAFHPNLKERQPQRVLQAELLRFCDGETARVREKDSEIGTPFRTHHLLFIGVGAFQSLGNLVDPHDPQGYIKATPDHIVRYGFLEELAGRFSTIIGLPMLDSNSMYDILRDHIWPNYVQQAEDDGIVLDVDETALRGMVDMAMSQRVGARGLIPICEQMLWKAWASAKPGDHIAGDHQHIPTGFQVA